MNFEKNLAESLKYSVISATTTVGDKLFQWGTTIEDRLFQWGIVLGRRNTSGDQYMSGAYNTVSCVMVW